MLRRRRRRPCPGLSTTGTSTPISLSCRKLLPQAPAARRRSPAPPPSPSPQRPCKDVNSAASYPVPGSRIPAPAIKTPCGIQTLPSISKSALTDGAGTRRPGPEFLACPLVLLIPSCRARVRHDLAEVVDEVVRGAVPAEDEVGAGQQRPVLC